MNIIYLITIILAFIYGGLILWYYYGWNRLPFFDDSACSFSGKTKVTVIIPARNEERYITGCLRAVTDQTYPADLLEVIVVNDHSTDNTAALAASFPAQNLRVIDLEEYMPAEQKINAYKKKAIEIAVGQATGQLIITTDADCVMERQWIETVVKFYESGEVKFIAAPVVFSGENNFFNVFQSLDFMTMQGITGATVKLKCGSMCNGANLAYEKKSFNEVGGFKGVDCIASGDDMLLMYKMYKAYPSGIGFLKSRKAIVSTPPADSFRGFMNQRIRWSSKADKYDDKRLTLVLALVYLWNLWLLALLVIALFNAAYWKLWVALLLYKTVVELFFLFPVARFFRRRHLLWQFFPSQFFHIPYVVVAGWLGKFGTYQWKERKQQ